jgi:hypothetical protein
LPVQARVLAYSPGLRARLEVLRSRVQRLVQALTFLMLPSVTRSYPLTASWARWVRVRYGAELPVGLYR